MLSPNLSETNEKKSPSTLILCLESHFKHVFKESFTNLVVYIWVIITDFKIKAGSSILFLRTCLSWISMYSIGPPNMAANEFIFEWQMLDLLSSFRDQWLLSGKNAQNSLGFPCEFLATPLWAFKADLHQTIFVTILIKIRANTCAVEYFRLLQQQNSLDEK